MFFKVILILIFVTGTRMQSFPNSAAGPYYVKWKEIGACPVEKRGTNEVFVDTYFLRRNRKLLVVGNFSLLIPFDDDISIDVDFAIHNTKAAWLPNYFTFHFTEACSTALKFVKNTMKSIECPFSKGIYEVRGFDINELLRRSLFPKEFIYGRYKVTAKFIKYKKVVGCHLVVLELIPAWQRKSKDQTIETNQNK